MFQVLRDSGLIKVKIGFEVDIPTLKERENARKHRSQRKEAGHGRVDPHSVMTEWNPTWSWPSGPPLGHDPSGPGQPSSFVYPGEWMPKLVNGPQNLRNGLRNSLRDYHVSPLSLRYK